MISVWLGSIFIKNEGGFEILVKALRHYKKRLKTIGSTPELEDAPMFVQIVQQEAMKTVPQIDLLIEKINQSLTNDIHFKDLQHQIPILEKSLRSYSSDIDKALNTTQPYYSQLFPQDLNLSHEISNINTALEKINAFE